jgi:NAD(P)-dependent dehydrogenase (short-subunit alcohol dehydrogenase family)
MKILVTGGASGLGKAIVSRLAREKDFFIYFTYARSANDAMLLESEFSNVEAFRCDFKSEDDIAALLSQLGNWNIDVLVNNANTGIETSHFHKIDHQVFLQKFAENVVPVLRITQEVIKTCRKKKFGKIINIISSAIINKPPVGWSEYVACKAYLAAMSKSWATENIKFNITSNSISPAFMLTSMTKQVTDERVIEAITENHALKKLLTVDEVAEAVCFFMRCSQQINGTNLVMNAGSDII